MDALYLKNNVYTALTEALASMAVALPDDKVEYLGKYLLKYVDRKMIKEEVDLSLQDILLREEAENLNNSIAQEAEVASKKRDNEIYLEKQKAEQTKFAKVNDNVHNLFAKLMGRIEEIDIAAFAVQPECSITYELTDEEGNKTYLRPDDPDSTALETPVASDLEAEGDTDTHNGEEEKLENGEKALTLLDIQNNWKRYNCIGYLFGGRVVAEVHIANEAILCMDQWTISDFFQYTTPMDERVVALLHYVSLIAGLDPGYSIDPQTKKPSWKVIRMSMLSAVMRAMVSYDATKVRRVPLTSSYAYVMERCEAMDLLESSSFPKCFPAIELMSIWFKRALFARGQAILYYAQKGQKIETIQEFGKNVGDDEDDE